LEFSGNLSDRVVVLDNKQNTGDLLMDQIALMKQRISNVADQDKLLKCDAWLKLARLGDLRNLRAFEDGFFTRSLSIVGGHNYWMMGRRSSN
jgi:hypothetical protein